MRKRFGDWGAELSDADFACALAAAGVFERWRIPREVDLQPGALGSRLWLWSREGPLLWRLTRPPRLDARLLLESWRSFRQLAGPESFRIEVQASAFDLRWVLKQLSRPEVGAAAVESLEPPPVRGRRKSPTEGSYSVRDPEAGDDGVRGLGRGEALEATGPSGEEAGPPARFLQARMAPPVQPAWEYRVFVRIGMPDRGWASVEKPFPSPSETETHELTVIFWEPTVSPDPQIQLLRLPPKGNSSEVRFAFPAAEGLKSIAARITVVHKNRVLQTGLLRASLPALSWTFELDATPRAHLEGLSGRSRFDLALVLNHDAEGIPRMTVVADDRAVVIPVGESEVEALTRALGDQISRIAAEPERYETLQSEGSEELLRTLAQHGGLLHQYLSGFEMLGRLEAANGHQPRVHLTAARPDSFFPIELLYRFEIPEDTAKLCSHALAALAQGSCPAECPSEKSETVCPLGFWGMCRVIERHNHRRVEKRPQTGFDLRPEPVQPRSRLDISGKALVAASDAASRHDAGAVESLLEKLRRRGPAEEVRSWKDWRARVAADHPKLLVLLPHHERKDGFEILQIGAADVLKFVKPEHVDPGSIVLLMGCETNLAKIAFDSFVIQFILNGAAIVVSTIATILGRHASPATARLVELLDEEAREEDSTFGEVMLRLRQKLVAEQTPMALGLTAYGDADWILTKGADALDRDARRPLR